MAENRNQTDQERMMAQNEVLDMENGNNIRQVSDKDQVKTMDSQQIMQQSNSDTGIGMDESAEEKMAELIYRLDLNCARTEQSAYDSINATDQVMMRIQDMMEAMNRVMEVQNNLLNAIDMCTLSEKEAEGSSLLELAQEQASNLEKLEYQFHQVAEAGVEANDAVHCIEEGIADQNANVSELIELTQGFLTL